MGFKTVITSFQDFHRDENSQSSFIGIDVAMMSGLSLLGYIGIL